MIGNIAHGYIPQGGKFDDPGRVCLLGLAFAAA
jgi:hypothetical protein